MKKSLITYIVCVVFLFSSAFLFKKWDKPYGGAVIHSDVAGYYLYLPSYFYDDIGQLYNLDIVYANYKPSGSPFYGATWHPSYGCYIMKYTMGQAIMYLPAFAIAHVWASLGSYAVDGYSWPYQFCLAVWSVIVACIGLWFLRKMLLLHFNDKAVSISLLVLCFATNYFMYVSCEGSMAHNYLFTLYALIIYFTYRWYQKPTPFGTALLGLICGLTVLTRPSEIVCILIPIFWGIGSKTDLKQRLLLFNTRFYDVVLFVLYASMVGIFQFWYWKKYTGHFIFWSYGTDEGFNFLHSHFIKGLFSYKKGWFTYTPVMLLIVPGFAAIYRYKRNIFWWSILFTIINMYIIFSWKNWWYGGSFSQRALIQSYVVLSFPMSALFQYCLEQKFWSRLLVLFLVLCAGLNLIMTYQVTCNERILDPEYMTKAYFWRIFGKTSIYSDDRKLMDTDQEMPVALEKHLYIVSTIRGDDYPFTDTGFYFEWYKVWALNRYHQLSHDIKINLGSYKKGWLRVYALVYTPGMEYDGAKQTHFILTLKNKGSVVKERYIRIQPQLQDSTWIEIYQDIKIPSTVPTDTLSIKFWNNGSAKSLYIKSLRIKHAEAIQKVSHD